MLARSGSAQPETPVCSACLEAPALCQSTQRHQAVFMGTERRRAGASPHRPADDMKRAMVDKSCARTSLCPVSGASARWLAASLVGLLISSNFIVVSLLPVSGLF